MLFCGVGSVQKQRATRSEDALEQLNAQVLEREQGLLDLRAEHDRLQTNHDKLLKERAKLDKENADMRRYDVAVTVSVFLLVTCDKVTSLLYCGIRMLRTVCDVTVASVGSRLRDVETDGKTRSDHVTLELQDKVTENARLQLDVDHLKVSSSPA